MDDHAEQQHTFQHGGKSRVQRERVLLGVVQDLQAAPTHGPGADAAAGLAALPRGEVAAVPDSVAAGRLPPRDGVFAGHGLGQQSPPLPLQVGGHLYTLWCPRQSTVCDTDASSRTHFTCTALFK